MQIAPETPVDKRICPECGGPKKGSAKNCKPCYYARGFSQCSEPMCTNVALAKGLCNTHRLRLKRNGTTEHLCSRCPDQATNLAGIPLCDGCRAAGALRTRRNAELKAAYGIKLDDYDRMFASQSGACAICATTSPGRGHDSLSVDHDHTTGRIRGLLCHACNIGVGMFRNDPELLAAAIRYLAAT